MEITLVSSWPLDQSYCPVFLGLVFWNSSDSVHRSLGVSSHLAIL